MKRLPILGCALLLAAAAPDSAHSFSPGGGPAQTAAWSSSPQAQGAQAPAHAPSSQERPEKPEERKPDSHPPAFLGETLRYAMTILGVAGGELTLSAQPSDLNGHAAWKFELSAVSNDFLSKFFLVRDYMVSWVDPKTFRSLRFEKHTVEGKRARDELTEFDYENGVAKHEGKSIRLNDATLDTLSSVYYLRTLGLTSGAPAELQVFSGETHVLKVEVQGRERIVTPAGTFDTVRVEPKSAGGSLIGKGKNLVLWLTEDERHVPVQIRSKLKVGTLVGKLKSIEK